MKVAVTGAGGFVGGALCSALTVHGHAVTACVRGNAAPAGADRVARIADITDRPGLESVFAQVDAVVHLAGRAHVMQDDSADPLAEYRRINVDGTKAVCEAAAGAGVGRVVFMSSVKVNGERSGDRSLTEDDPPRPEDPYGITKMEAEKALFHLAAARGFEAVCLRPPLVYGPGVRANFASLMKLCDSILPLPFGAIVQNRRSLIYVGNLVSAIEAALTHENAPSRTFLVRDGEDLSTAGLVRILRTAMGRPARLLSVPPALLDAALRLAGRAAMAERLLGSLSVDDSAIRESLGWTAPCGVAEAMAETVAGRSRPS